MSFRMLLLFNGGLWGAEELRMLLRLIKWAG